MLKQMLNEHNSKLQQRKKEQDAKRKEFISSAHDLTEAVMEHLNLGVAQAYLNQKKIDEEVKLLRLNLSQFAKQTSGWVSVINEFNDSLKQIGDLENWARTIENDMKTVVDSLDRIHCYELDHKQQSSSSGNH